MVEGTDKELVLGLLDRRGVPYTVNADGQVVVRCLCGVGSKVNVYFVFREGDELHTIAATLEK